MTGVEGLPSACPVCGAYSTAATAQASALLAVCDVLVMRALEVVGSRIIRSPRGRYADFERVGIPKWEAHTLWPPTDETFAGVLSQTLDHAWDPVPALLRAHGCGVVSDDVCKALDSYTRDLLITGTRHTLTDLRYRLEAFLGVRLKELSLA